MKIVKLFLPLLLCFNTMFCTEKSTPDVITNFIIENGFNTSEVYQASKCPKKLKKVNIYHRHFDQFTPEDSRKEVYKKFFKKTLENGLYDSILRSFVISTEEGKITIDSHFVISEIDSETSRTTERKHYSTEDERLDFQSLIDRSNGSTKTNGATEKIKDKYTECKYTHRSIEYADHTFNARLKTNQARGNCTTEMPVEAFRELIKRYNKNKEKSEEKKEQSWFSRYLPSW